MDMNVTSIRHDNLVRRRSRFLIARLIGSWLLMAEDNLKKYSMKKEKPPWQ
jgi:hypothetical protein